MISRKKSRDPSIGSYQSGRIYRKAIISGILQQSIDYEGIARNPVIVVHGFLGSHLKNKQTEKDVWGSFKGIDAIRGYSQKELKELSLPMEQGKTLRELKDDIIPTELLSTFDINLFGVHFQQDAYDKLLAILSEAGYNRDDIPLSKGKNYHSLFSFYYDWRRDIQENAAKLHDFVLEKRAYIQKKYKELYNIDEYDVHFDFLAHSMGGLLARYYLRFGIQDLPSDDSLPNFNWEGSKYIDKLFFIGTPNAGYLDTVIELINGLQISKHSPFYPPAVIGTFHTYYQMMPLIRNRQLVYADDPEGDPVDIYDPQVWIDLKWGLANPEQDKILKILLPKITEAAERRKIAIDHLAKCLKRAKQFTRAMLTHHQSEKSWSSFLFLGDAVKTRRTATVNRKTGEIKISAYSAGDGKVLAASARMDEADTEKWKPFIVSPVNWDAVIHLRAAHMGITAGNGFAHNLLYYLLAVPPKSYEKRIKKLKG